MNINEAVQYLYNVPKFSKKTTLENTVKILELMGNPQDGIKFFHVAGSNGKGSVCAFLNSMLVRGGLKTGMFTSPHLVYINERIKINNQMISDDEFLSAFEKVLDIVKNGEKDGIVHPSFFEFLFLMALSIFADNNVEYGVIEVGLGGRLDATNVIKSPLVSVITSLSLEHTEILGDSIEKIAYEKAGIIKEKVPVVAYDSCKEASAVIQSVAEAHNSKLYFVSNEDIKILKKSDKYIDFSLKSKYYNIDILRSPFPAPYQTVNASLAYTAMKAAGENDCRLRELKDNVLADAVEKTAWEGRMEQISHNVYVDGAHNVSGIEKFVEAVDDIYTHGKKILLFSVVREKDYSGMIAILLNKFRWNHIFVTHLNTERGMDSQFIENIFVEQGFKREAISSYGNVRDAYHAARNYMDKEDVLFCAGSLYLVGEIKTEEKND